MEDAKICFVIAPIGEPDSETRKRSDQVLKHVIKPATKERGFTAIRADQISETGFITSQVIQHLVNDPLVVADLTDRNPNVFYELAIRHAARKPLVQLIRKGDQIPFDVSGMRTIALDHRDLDSVEEVIQEILRQIDSSLKPGAVIESPIQGALKLLALQQSDDPESRTLAGIVEELTEIRAALTRLESTSSTQTFLQGGYIPGRVYYGSTEPIAVSGIAVPGQPILTNQPHFRVQLPEGSKFTLGGKTITEGGKTTNDRSTQPESKKPRKKDDEKKNS
jgi:hypothetical protein